MAQAISDSRVMVTKRQIFLLVGISFGMPLLMSAAAILCCPALGLVISSYGTAALAGTFWWSSRRKVSPRKGGTCL